MSSDVNAYSQLDEVISRARETALSYYKCRQIIEEKSTASSANNDYSIRVETVRLFPGHRDVLLGITFPDGERLQVSLDADNEIVHWVKNYK